MGVEEVGFVEFDVWRCVSDIKEEGVSLLFGAHVSNTIKVLKRMRLYE